MTALRRFIAGAVCPACDKTDKLFMYTDDDGQRICECAACGFRDERSRDAKPGTSEYKRGLGESDVQVVRMLDPGNS